MSVYGDADIGEADVGQKKKKNAGKIVTLNTRLTKRLWKTRWTNEYETKKEPCLSVTSSDETV